MPAFRSAPPTQAAQARYFPGAAMIYSMTGFARREERGPWGRLVWELRSVNHRYLGPSLRLPEEVRALAGGIRERIGGQRSRGNVDVSLRWDRSEASDVQMAVNGLLGPP